jgi:hypothetical protein
VRFGEALGSRARAVSFVTPVKSPTTSTRNVPPLCGHPLHHLHEGTMVHVIHLAQGKQPDGSEGCIVIERCAPGGRTTVARSPDGILVKVPAPFLETEIDAFCRMAEAAGIAKLYVRGAPEGLREDRNPPALSPWAA